MHITAIKRERLFKIAEKEYKDGTIVHVNYGNSSGFLYIPHSKEEKESAYILRKKMVVIETIIKEAIIRKDQKVQAFNLIAKFLNCDVRPI